MRFPVTCPVLVRSLLDFKAQHADRESFERQMTYILSPDNQILHTLVRFPSGTYPFAGVTKPLRRYKVSNNRGMRFFILVIETFGHIYVHLSRVIQWINHVCFPVVCNCNCWLFKGLVMLIYHMYVSTRFFIETNKNIILWGTHGN